MSAIEVDNVAAVQFHPEKSSTLGLRFYRNFARRAGWGGCVRLFPAIDIQGGRCVRLRRGDFADETVFGDDPVAMARTGWARARASCTWSTLTGPATGAPRNFALIRAIAEAVPIPIETGGGIRTEETLQLIAGSRVAKRSSAPAPWKTRTFSTGPRRAWAPTSWWWPSTPRTAL